MSARILARAAAAVTALVTLSGCAGWGFSTGGAAGTVTLTYALWDPHEQIGYQQSIDERHVVTDQQGWPAEGDVFLPHDGSGLSPG